MDRKKIKKDSQQQSKQSLFEGRLMRLKEAFKCHSDSELARKMGISHQRVYAAKKRMQIPNSFLDIAAKHNLPIDYIMEGPEYIAKGNQLHCETDLSDLEAHKEGLISEFGAIENNDAFAVSGHLVNLALTESGISLTIQEKLVFARYVRTHILPKMVTEIKGELESFKILRQPGRTEPHETEGLNSQ